MAWQCMIYEYWNLFLLIAASQFKLSAAVLYFIIQTQLNFLNYWQLRKSLHILLYMYISLYLHYSDCNYWPTVFKFGSIIPFCNSLNILLAKITSFVEGWWEFTPKFKFWSPNEYFWRKHLLFFNIMVTKLLLK